MAHLFVTICMLCLLCTAHVCCSHVEVKRDLHNHAPTLTPEPHHVAFNVEKRSVDSDLIYKQRPQNVHIDVKRDLHNHAPTLTPEPHHAALNFVKRSLKSESIYERRPQNLHVDVKRDLHNHAPTLTPEPHHLEKRNIESIPTNNMQLEDLHDIIKRDLHNHAPTLTPEPHHAALNLEKRSIESEPIYEQRVYNIHKDVKRDLHNHAPTVTPEPHRLQKRSAELKTMYEQRPLNLHRDVKRDVHNHAPTLTPEPHHATLNLDKRSLDSKLTYQQRLKEIRQKREVRNVNPSAYIEQIFKVYGDAGSMTMNLSGFNRMLEGLDLHKLIEGGIYKTENKDYIYWQSGAKEDVVNCVSSGELITTVNTKLKPHEHAHEHHNHDETENLIFEDTFKSICPILLYQKLANTSIERYGCLKESYLPNRIDKEITHIENENAYSKNMFAVWLYSSLSITAISACGLLGVAVIPIMHKTYYNHLLQFLVALAVGTLCGDALLHLMPHAMSPAEHDHSNETGVEVRASHDDGMWKGLAAMLGVVFFYFTEKGLTVVVEWRKRRQKLEDDKLPSRVRVLKDETVGGCSGGAKAPITNATSNSLMKIFKRDEKGDPTTKTCKHKYSEYPYCYDEIDTDTHDDHHLRDGLPPSPKANNKHNNSVSVVSSNALNPEGKENEPTAKDWLLKAETTPAVVEMNNIKHKEDGMKDMKDGDSYTVILREHSRAHHGHSHAHGHVHAPPSSMSSVAWMVIMGDGLHNFTDGMAIGAAFASNIAGGFSTAIAVLCHELPHELGDFAVLLKAGMSVKRAVCYNVLSSALCLAGMICGVLAGHLPNATRWLFAAAAGMFLYIALVDMMPELSTSHSKEGTLCQCILQLMGLATGIGIMLVIALYEHDLKNLFG